MYEGQQRKIVMYVDPKDAGVSDGTFLVSYPS